jgi:hypothetical protein
MAEDVASAGRPLSGTLSTRGPTGVTRCQIHRRRRRVVLYGTFRTERILMRLLGPDAYSTKSQDCLLPHHRTIERGRTRRLMIAQDTGSASLDRRAPISTGAPAMTPVASAVAFAIRVGS